MILDGQCSSRENIFSGVPPSSDLGPHLFLTYINDFPHGFISICKIFADDTSILSKVFDKDKSQRDLDNDLSIKTQPANINPQDIARTSPERPLNILFDHLGDVPI